MQRAWLYRLARGGKPPVVPLITLSGALQASYLGQEHFSFLSASGGIGPYEVHTSGTTPPGLTLEATPTAVTRTGIPTGYGNASGFTYSIWLTDSVGNISNVVQVNEIVHVWNAPTFARNVAKKTRVRYAGHPCGYLGQADTTNAFSTAVAVVAGDPLGHWQTQDAVMGSAYLSGGNTIFQRAAGLAPKGSVSNLWDAVWPSTGDASDLYPGVVLEHLPTGQRCTVTIDTLYDREWNGTTYSSANGISIATAFEFCNPADNTVYANKYIKRNASEGGLIEIVDGANIWGELPNYGYARIGGSTFAAGSVGFTPGTFDVDINPGFQATHGDLHSGRQIKGMIGGNYTLVTGEKPFGSTLSTGQTNFDGMLFAQLNLGRINLAANDYVFDCVRSLPKSGGDQNTGIMGISSATLARRGVIVNSYFEGWQDYAISTHFLEVNVCGNLFNRLGQDSIHLAVDPTWGPTGANPSVQGKFRRNIFININFDLGGHPDGFQLRVFRATGQPNPGVIGVLLGEIEVFENFDAQNISQFIFLGGGQANLEKYGMRAHHNFSYGCEANQIIYRGLSTADIYCNTFLPDVNSAKYDPAKSPSIALYDAGSCDNVSVQDNVASVITTPVAAVSTTFSGTAGAASGDNLLIAKTAAALNAALEAPATNPGGMAAQLVGVNTYEEAFAILLNGFRPKNLSRASGGFKRTDGTGLGGLRPGPLTSCYEEMNHNVRGVAWS
jgi:hypothetical protein